MRFDEAYLKYHIESPLYKNRAEWRAPERPDKPPRCREAVAITGNYETKYMILKNIELCNGELSLRSLCEELGGELYTKSHKKNLYGACVVDAVKAEDVLFPEDTSEEEDNDPA